MTASPANPAGAEPPAATLDPVANWDAVAVGFARTQRRLLAAIEAEGVPGPSFEALRLLLNSPERRLPMSRLARDLSMTAGGLTKLADRLARDGLIDRRNSSDDRRVVYAALTDKGAELAVRLIDIYRAGLREHVLSTLQTDDLTELARMMRELGAAHAGELEPEAAEPSEAPGDGAARSGAGDGIVLTDRDPALPERRRRDLDAP